MKSTNFLVATIDQGFNLFKIDQDHNYQFVEKIAEHIKRLEEISDGHHFYIDDYAFQALGSKNFPLRFTRIFSKNPHAIEKSNAYRVHEVNDLERTIMSKERYSPEVQIFFIGSSEFLMNASKYAKKLLLTVANVDRSETAHIIDQFPVDQMKKIFTKRKDISPEMLDAIKSYQKAYIKKQQQKTETIVTDNGMKLTREVDATAPIIDAGDEILNTPDYMFYEFSR